MFTQEELDLIESMGWRDLSEGERNRFSSIKQKMEAVNTQRVSNFVGIMSHYHRAAQENRLYALEADGTLWSWLEPQGEWVFEGPMPKPREGG